MKKYEKRNKRKENFLCIYNALYKAFIIHNSSVREMAGSILWFLATRQVPKNSTIYLNGNHICSLGVMINTRCPDRRAKQQILILFRHITPLSEVLTSEFTSLQTSTHFVAFIKTPVRSSQICCVTMTSAHVSIATNWRTNWKRFWRKRSQPHWDTNLDFAFKIWRNPGDNSQSG